MCSFAGVPTQLRAHGGTCTNRRKSKNWQLPVKGGEPDQGGARCGSEGSIVRPRAAFRLDGTVFFSLHIKLMEEGWRRLCFGEVKRQNIRPVTQ